MLQRNFLDVTPHHSLIKSLYPSNKKCYLCTATLHWPLIKWCMMESKLLLNCKYSLHRHFKPQQNFQDLHDDKKVDCYVRKIFHKRFNHVFKLLTKDFKSFPLAKLYNFCNNFFVKNVEPTDLNSWVGNWEHLTSMEKVFTNSMKDNMSHQLPSTAAQSIRGNLISSEIIWAKWKHQCLSNVNFIFDRIYIVFKG